MSTQIPRRSIAKGAAWATPAVLLTTAAPAAVASVTTDPNYRFRASHYAYRDCTNYILGVTNQVQMGTSPLGFTVVNEPMTGSSTMSPTTAATIQSLQYVIGFPKEWISSTYIANPFNFTNGTGSNWTLAGRTERYMTDQFGNSTTYVIYTFNFNGPLTSATVPNGNSPQPWPNSAFSATLDYGQYLCYNYYGVWSGYNATITTANGETLTSTLPPQWVTLS